MRQTPNLLVNKVVILALSDSITCPKIAPIVKVCE
ncbi:hypothetical protein MGSAQ_000873 [marine sediment metagenome]|uniref:Uncharacterized protein n=1 Tax=marine sediment metagenome TaxID=412755 RepID=A0A1B6NWB4_9ZZZZ